MSGQLLISLSALAANYNQLQATAQGKVGAVVKADAYGLGATEIATHLSGFGCDTFFVANCAEGVGLRRALADAQIYVFEGVYAETTAAMVAADLIPVLNTPEQVKQWASTGRSAAIHVDTGMQRLGFPYLNGVAVIPDIPVGLNLLISHFARADEPGHPSLTQQIERTQTIYRSLLEQHPQLRLSLCNSAGILQGLGPEHLGRAGIALYGGNPYHDQANPMQPIGYGGAFVTQRKTRLAVVGVGYADGYPRLVSGRAEVAVDGQRCPVVGRVSMDLTCVDVTGLDVTEGDWVEMFGSVIPLDEVAAHAQTIAYEILTGLGKRLPRHYQN